VEETTAKPKPQGKEIGPVAELRTKAEAGDPESQYTLGRRCFYGEGVEKDLAAAVQWWQTAAEKGNPAALNAMGICYERGEGVGTDMARALEYYSAAAAKGHENAQTRLKQLASEGYTKGYVEQLKSPRDLTSPEGAIKAYLNAPTIGQRTECVRLREETKTVMEKRYAEVQPGAWPLKFDADSLRAERLGESGSTAAFKVSVKTFGDWRFESVTYYVVKLGREYKVDWEASMGINPTKLIAFKVTKPSRPQIFRLSGRLGDYYNWEFSGSAAEYYSIRLRESDREFSHDDITGYIAKRSKDGQFLFRLMSDGAEHQVSVELRYSPVNQNPEVALISRVVGDGWFIP
jgi:hypothetical protein